jgi:predicted AAA+ superfamily ATPase
VGKTTGLQQIVKSRHGLPLMISADELITPTTDWLQLNGERARNLGAGALFVIDKIQKISDWSTVVKYLFDQDRAFFRLKIVLLGSASLGLQRGLLNWQCPTRLCAMLSDCHYPLILIWTGVPGFLKLL